MAEKKSKGKTKAAEAAKERPRFRAYETVEEFEARVNAYFLYCFEHDDIFPDEAGLFEFLKIRPRDADIYREDPDFREVLDMALRKRESWLARKMVREPKLANGCLSALKQAKNGGYVDKQPLVKAEAKTLIIKTDGVGEGAFD